MRCSGSKASETKLSGEIQIRTIKPRRSAKFINRYFYSRDLHRSSSKKHSALAFANTWRRTTDILQRMVRNSDTQIRRETARVQASQVPSGMGTTQQKQTGIGQFQDSSMISSMMIFRISACLRNWITC